MRKTKWLFMMITLGFMLTAIAALAQQHSIIKTQKININTATVEELQELPGIGSSISQEIINYRHAHGAFQKIEDITQVKGIGEKKFEKIKDLITVGEAK